MNKPNLEDERTWKEFPPDKEYWFSRDGRVWSTKSKSFLNGTVTQSGFVNICLYHRKSKGGRGRTSYQIHAIIMDMFGPKPGPGEDSITHMDRNKLNNHVDNLMWYDKRDHNGMANWMEDL